MLFYCFATINMLRHAYLSQFRTVALEKRPLQNQCPELCAVCRLNHEINHHLHDRTINCDVTVVLRALCHHK